MCQTMNGMWGYKVADQNYKSVSDLVRLIVKAASKGSNLLLNVGPQPDGNLPAVAVERLKGIGEWMGVFGESVYGTAAAGLPEPEWGVLTRRDNVLYMHVFQPKEGGAELDLSELPKKTKIRSVTSLKNGAALDYTFKNGRLTVGVPCPGQDPDFVVKVLFR